MTPPDTADYRTLHERCDECGRNTTYVSMWPWDDLWLCFACAELRHLLRVSANDGTRTP
jgi:ribosomal protein S14